MFLSLLLSIPPGSGRSVFVLLPPALDWTLDFLSAGFPGILGNAEPAVLVCYGWIRLSGYSESEINAAQIYPLFAHLPAKSWTQMWE